MVVSHRGHGGGLVSTNAGRPLRIHYLQHVPFEQPARIATWARRRGDTLAGCRLWQGQPFPSLPDFDWLVIMGGPMSVDDERVYPWLVEEKKLIERAVEAGKRVLGVCLGAQLLADVLGGKVYKNEHKEIGWFPVQVNQQAGPLRPFAGFPETFKAFHWHGETFDLPAGAIHLAQSVGCKNQAFAFGKAALGIQFHLEVTPDSVSELIRNCSGDIAAGPYEQSAEQMLAQEADFATIERLLYRLLDRLAAHGNKGVAKQSHTLGVNDWEKI